MCFVEKLNLVFILKHQIFCVQTFFGYWTGSNFSLKLWNEHGIYFLPEIAIWNANYLEMVRYKQVFSSIKYGSTI